jgi:hypothetical protein
MHNRYYVHLLLLYVTLEHRLYVYERKHRYKTPANVLTFVK